MRPAGVPLFSVENHRPARDFDVLAFNLSAELVYTNVLNLIDLAGVPVRVRADRGRPDRGGRRPLRLQPRTAGRFRRCLRLGRRRGGRRRGDRRAGALAGRGARGPRPRRGRSKLSPGSRASTCPRSTWPSSTGERLASASPIDGRAPAEIVKRTIADLAEWPYPKHQLVPLTEVVHDRLNVEVFRGCTRGCRFCQAGMITRPVRERPAAQVRTMIRAGLDRTGYDEVALTSLSTADFSAIEDTVKAVVSGECGASKVSVSLPSLRVDAFTVSTATQIAQARRTGLTFAPEGGTWRMRTIINKLITEEDLYGAVDAAFSNGWRRVKLYFLIGLPTEQRRGRAGNRRAGPAMRRDRAAAPPGADRGGLGRGLRAQAPHPVPVVRPGHGARTAPQGQPLEGRLPGRAGPVAALARPRGVGGRGTGLAGRPPDGGGHRAGVAGRRDLPGVVRVLRPRQVGGGARRRGALIRVGGPPRPRRGRGAGLGPPLGRPAPRLPLERLAGRAGRRWRSQDCRWTPCYDCGACTDAGLEHVVASAVPPAGGSQGTGPGPLGRRPGAGPLRRAAGVR